MCVVSTDRVGCQPPRVPPDATPGVSGDLEMDAVSAVFGVEVQVMDDPTDALKAAFEFLSPVPVRRFRRHGFLSVRMPWHQSGLD